MAEPKQASRYEVLVEHIFQKHYQPSMTVFEFDRAELEDAAISLTVKLPKNLGGVLYSFRFRRELPESIRATATDGFVWIIESAGIARYRFRLARASRIAPNPNLVEIKIPDATPEIVARYAHGDEQALLAKVRYNRLIDIFLGVTTYSLQNHLRTTVKGIGQIEVDELYVGLNRHGIHFVIPIQAKGGSDQIGVVQTRQDVLFCRERFPNLVCRAVAAQFLPNGAIALFELLLDGEELRIVEEKHYRLVSGATIDEALLRFYQERSS